MFNYKLTMSHKCKPWQVCFRCLALLKTNYTHPKVKVGRDSTPPIHVGVISPFLYFQIIYQTITLYP